MLSIITVKNLNAFQATLTRLMPQTKAVQMCCQFPFKVIQSVKCKTQLNALKNRLYCRCFVFSGVCWTILRTVFEHNNTLQDFFTDVDEHRLNRGLRKTTLLYWSVRSNHFCGIKVLGR